VTVTRDCIVSFKVFSSEFANLSSTNISLFILLSYQLTAGNVQHGGFLLTRLFLVSVVGDLPSPISRSAELHAAALNAFSHFNVTGGLQAELVHFLARDLLSLFGGCTLAIWRQLLLHVVHVNALSSHLVVKSVHGTTIR